MWMRQLLKGDNFRQEIILYYITIFGNIFTDFF